MLRHVMWMIAVVACLLTRPVQAQQPSVEKVILLIDGRAVTGTILSDDGQQLSVRLQSGEKQTIKRSDVEDMRNRVQSSPSDQAPRASSNSGGKVRKLAPRRKRRHRCVFLRKFARKR